MSLPFHDAAEHLVAISRALHGRGWLLATSGNLSAVVAREPLRLAITPGGVDKEALTPAAILLVDAGGTVVGGGDGPPSAETQVHLRLAAERGAGAVFHTHSVWGTALSEHCAGDGELVLEGYEMLKALEGVATHEHRETLPVVENHQEAGALAAAVLDGLERHPEAHGVLIRKHGLYTWGADPAAARRHVEAIEFLLEAEGRTRLSEERWPT